MGVEVFRLAMFDISDRHSQSRFITEITKDNIKFCKELLKVGKLRHLEGVKGNFAVSEKEYTGVCDNERSATTSSGYPQ